MIALNHRLTLEMTTLNSQATVHIKKNDTKNKLVVSLSENGKPYKLSKNVYAAFVGKKPDGKIVFNDCDIVGNTITYTITAQTSVVAGIVACEIRLYDINDNLLTSPNFTVVVDETIYNADDVQIESENEINVLDSLISEAKALIAEVEATKNVFFAIYGTTTLEEIEAAVADGKTVFCKCEESSVILQLPLTRHFHKVRNAVFSGAGAYGDNNAFVYVASIGTSGVWSLKKHEIKDNDELFITEYDVTPFEDVADAIENGLAVFCKLTENDTTVLIPLTQYNGAVARFELLYGVAHQPTEWTLHNYSIFVSASGWEDDEKNSTLIVGDRGTGTPNAVQYIPQELTKEQQAQARANIGADASGAAASAVSEHNTSDKAHNDIRIELKAVADRIAAVLDSDDTTLDELSEIVAYIKANKTLIDSITTSKVNVTDIINNLTSNVTNKPLSAAQGVALKALIDAIIVPTKVSELANDKGYLTSFTESDPTVPAWAKQDTKPSYTKSEVGLGNVDNVKQYSASNPPPYPVTKVNGKTGNVVLDAEAVGARADTWMPTYSEIGAEKSGTASSAVSAHNTNETAHNDIRLLIEGLTTRLNALANSTDEDLDQMAEVVAYIKANKQLIDSITTSKVSVADIVNNLTTNVTNKPLSAAQGVALKALIDAITVPTKLSELTNDAGYLTQHQDLSGYAKKSGLSLGIASDGLIYIFVDGVPVGTGIPQGQTADVYGYIDENNHITFTGKNVPDGSYTCSFDMENGSTVPIGAFVKDMNTYYSITSNLTNCTNSNNTKTVVEGESYSATITANSGYVLKSVSVTMGGSAVSVSGGVINIASVTGNIVITAVAEVAAPTNLLPEATFTDSELSSFTTVQKQESANGYVSGYRLSASKGSLSASSAHYTSGFVPVGVNDTVTIENITLDQSSGNVNNIVFYDSAKTFVYGVGGPSGGKVFGSGVTVNNGVYTFTPTSCGAGAKAVGYFRVSCASITTDTIIIVTKA